MRRRGFRSDPRLRGYDARHYRFRASLVPVVESGSCRCARGAGCLRAAGVSIMKALTGFGRTDLGAIWFRSGKLRRLAACRG